MLLRISISDTKEFFQKALQNFKSFFCPGYQKLPKTPPHNRFSFSVAAASVMELGTNHNYEELEKFYSDFTEKWDSEKEKASKRNKKKAVLSSTKQEKEVRNESSISLNNASLAQEKNQMEKREECGYQNNKRSLTHQRGKQQDSSFNAMVDVREQRTSMVEKKLRDLEMLDMSDVDHVLDIEEVLHYYSRLTCPLYLEIVDKFFMEIYTEFFSSARPASPRSVNSKLKLRSVRF